MTFCKHIPGLEVTASHSDEVVIGMPIHTQNSGAKWLLDVLAHPPMYKSVFGAKCIVLGESGF